MPEFCKVFEKLCRFYMSAKFASSYLWQINEVTFVVENTSHCI